MYATYVPVYHGQVNGGIAFTGNTLGLDKANNKNDPGTAGSIGAFISQDMSSKVGRFPLGTTLNYLENGSTAVLDLPADSVILHAELIWSGSYGYGTPITLALAQTHPVTLITPSGRSHSVNPRKDTAQNRAHNSSHPGGFYVCSADVTAIVGDAGGGKYTVGSVPGTVDRLENANNCAGWTLAIAYSNPSMLTSSLHLYVGCAWSGDKALDVSGFRTPSTGTFASRVFVSALEGDERLSGDQFLVNQVPLSGTNNPLNNFFSSQINTIVGTTHDSNKKLILEGFSSLDIRGSFGTMNDSIGLTVAGARQGYDITSIPITLPNQATSMSVQGTTKGDGYTVNALGLQIQQASPIIQALTTQEAEGGKSAMSVVQGDILTYKSVFSNLGEGAASIVSFTCSIPPGMSLIQNSIKINGNHLAPRSDLVDISLPSLGQGNSNTVEFQMVVTNIIQQRTFPVTPTIHYQFAPYNGFLTEFTTCSNTVVAMSPEVPDPIAQGMSFELNAGSSSSGNMIINDFGVGLFVSSATSPLHGILSIQQNGDYTYIASSSFSGTDSFTYTISDERGKRASGIVDITILPLAVSDSVTIPGNIGTYEGESLLTLCYGSNLTVIPYRSETINHGIVVVLSDGSYTYTPPERFSGDDSFSYTIQDANGNTSTSNVSIVILPLAINDKGTTVANSPLHGFSVFANDPTLGVLTEYTQPQHGTVEMLLDGTYTYTPFRDFSGIDTFVYTIQDGAGQNALSTVTITVTPNVLPPDLIAADANMQLVGPSTLLNGAGSNLSIQSYDYTSVAGGVVEMNYKTGTYTYQPPPNFTGEDLFSFFAVDEIGQVTGRIPVTINVLPSSFDDIVYTVANTTLFGPTVLSNDEGNLLKVYHPGSGSTGQDGLVSLHSNGTYTYWPKPDFSGTDFFRYQAIDPSGQVTSPTTVTIIIKPQAQDGAIIVQKDTPYTGNSLLNLCIGNNLSILPNEVSTEKRGNVQIFPDGSYLYSPPTNLVGNDRFQYTVVGELNRSFSSRFFAPPTQGATGIISVTILPIIPPTISGDTSLNFKGTLSKGKFLHRTTYKLEATWTPLTSPNGGFYRIYSEGVVIAEIAYGDALVFSQCFKSKSLASGLEISFVYGTGQETSRERITIL